MRCVYGSVGAFGVCSCGRLQLLSSCSECFPVFVLLGGGCWKQLVVAVVFVHWCSFVAKCMIKNVFEKARAPSFTILT